MVKWTFFVMLKDVATVSSCLATLKLQNFVSLFRPTSVQENALFRAFPYVGVGQPESASHAETWYLFMRCMQILNSLPDTLVPSQQICWVACTILAFSSVGSVFDMYLAM